MAGKTEMVRDAYALFGRGEIERLLNTYIADDCEWTHAGSRDRISWAGTWKGKADIGASFQRMAETVNYTRFEPYQMVEQGDTVVVLGVAEGTGKASGKPMATEWAHVFRFNPDNRIVSYRSYFDTAAMASALS